MSHFSCTTFHLCSLLVRLTMLGWRSSALSPERSFWDGSQSFFSIFPSILEPSISQVLHKIMQCILILLLYAWCVHACALCIAILRKSVFSHNKFFSFVLVFWQQREKQAFFSSGNIRITCTHGSRFINYVSLLIP